MNTIQCSMLEQGLRFEFDGSYCADLNGSVVMESGNGRTFS